MLISMKVELSAHDLNEIAMCLRLGAKQCREDLNKATSFSVREHHERGAVFREELAERVQQMAKGR